MPDSELNDGAARKPGADRYAQAGRSASQQKRYLGERQHRMRSAKPSQSQRKSLTGGRFNSHTRRTEASKPRHAIPITVGKDHAVRSDGAEREEDEQSQQEQPKSFQRSSGPPNAHLNLGVVTSSRLAAARSRTVQKLDVSMSSQSKMKLQNADFELGSAQFDVPVMKYEEEQQSHYSGSPDRPSRLKRNQQNAATEAITQLESPNRLRAAGIKSSMQNCAINLDLHADKQGLFDQIRVDPNNNTTSSVIRTLTKYVTQRHTDEASVKVLLEQKKLKERIFDNIFRQFAQGSKLQKYDELKEMEDLRKRLSQRNDDDQLEQKKQNLKKKKKEEAEKQLNQLQAAAEKKEQEQNQKESGFMKAKQADDATAKKRFQLQSVREAVLNKQMTVDEANALLLRSAKTQNLKAFKDLKGGAQTKEFHHLLKKIGKALKEGTRSPRRSPSQNKKRSLEKKGASPRLGGFRTKGRPASAYPSRRDGTDGQRLQASNGYGQRSVQKFAKRSNETIQECEEERTARRLATGNAEVTGAVYGDPGTAAASTLTPPTYIHTIARDADADEQRDTSAGPFGVAKLTAATTASFAHEGASLDPGSVYMFKRPYQEAPHVSNLGAGHRKLRQSSSQKQQHFCRNLQIHSKKANHKLQIENSAYSDYKYAASRSVSQSRSANKPTRALNRGRSDLDGEVPPTDKYCYKDLTFYLLQHTGSSFTNARNQGTADYPYTNQTGAADLRASSKKRLAGSMSGSCLPAGADMLFQDAKLLGTDSQLFSNASRVYSNHTTTNGKGQAKQRLVDQFNISYRHGPRQNEEGGSASKSSTEKGQPADSPTNTGQFQDRIIVSSAEPAYADASQLAASHDVRPRKRAESRGTASAAARAATRPSPARIVRHSINYVQQRIDHGQISTKQQYTHQSRALRPSTSNRSLRAKGNAIQPSLGHVLAENELSHAKLQHPPRQQQRWQSGAGLTSPLKPMKGPVLTALKPVLNGRDGRIPTKQRALNSRQYANEDPAMVRLQV